MLGAMSSWEIFGNGVEEMIIETLNRINKYWKTVMKTEGIPEEIQCPVCGYFCLGKGGYGCIDKPSLVDFEEKTE